VGDEAGTPGTNDPWDDWFALELGDAFVRAAPVIEGSAEERVRDREASERARLLDQRMAEDDALEFLNARRSRRRQLTMRLVGLLILAGIAGGLYLAYVKRNTDLAALKHDADVMSIPPTRLDVLPPPSNEAESEPLGRPAALPEENGSFAFVATQAGGLPVAYDPCRPVRYVVNERTVPDGGAALLRDALDEVSRATGLVFIDDGVTTEKPSAQRGAFQPERYGQRWAPVLISWTDPDEVEILADRTIGSAGSLTLEVNGARALTASLRGANTLFVTGVVNLDGPELDDLIGDGQRDLARAVILHELGHLVGLDHVDDPDELMYPAATGEVTGFAAGDLRGLAALGGGACFPDV